MKQLFEDVCKGLIRATVNREIEWDRTSDVDPVYSYTADGDCRDILVIATRAHVQISAAPVNCVFDRSEFELVKQLYDCVVNETNVLNQARMLLTELIGALSEADCE